MAATTYNHLLTKGLKANLPATTSTSDKVRLTTDSQQLFIEDGNRRIEITDFVKGLTKQQILALTTPLDKIYLASDTFSLYYYNSTTHAWLNLSSVTIDDIDETDGLDFGDEDA